MFAQQSSQPKLSRRRYASVSYALQNNTVFRRAKNESVSVTDGSRADNGSEFQKQQSIIGRISLFWSVELQGHLEQLNVRDHDWLIQTPVSINWEGDLTNYADCCV